MPRNFISNIDEANRVIVELDGTVANHATAIENAKTAATTEIQGKLTAAETLAKTEGERATKAITDLATANARADKAEADLKDAKNATVTGAAAPGVVPVTGATKPDDTKKTELTGRARTVAAMATMQPNMGARK